jgi:hypothetical protein
MSGYVPNIPKAKREAELRGVTPVDLHAQRWSEYEKHSQQPAPAEEKVQVALRIGVFFDGTGNNADNSAMGLLCGAQHPVEPQDLDASCKPYMSDPDSSYGNDITNIKKLMELYLAPPSLEGEGLYKRASRKIYIDGIGTNAGAKDNLIGAATGRGETGIEERVLKAFGDIQFIVKDLHQENPGCVISSLTFDTFGFSRGAAAARHFANEVIRGRQGPLAAVLDHHVRVFSPTFVDREIRVGFIGLFDTVAAVAGLANFGNISSAHAPGVKLHLDNKYFPHVVHLVARDELRRNFALNSVKPGHTEITLPGVHSDIGGGYLADTEECVLISPMQALSVRKGVDVKTTSIYRDAAQAKARLINQGWPAADLEIVTPPPTLLPIDQQDRLAPRQQRVYAGVQIRRRLSGELSRVYMRVMYGLARQRGVLFEEIDEHNRNYSVPAKLQALCERFVSGDYTTSPAEEALLKSRYIHTSGHWNHPVGRDTPSGLKIIYINAPTADGVRPQHPHVPDWSLL